MNEYALVSEISYLGRAAGCWPPQTGRQNWPLNRLKSGSGSQESNEDRIESLLQSHKSLKKEKGELDRVLF